MKTFPRCLPALLIGLFSAAFASAAAPDSTSKSADARLWPLRPPGGIPRGSTPEFVHRFLGPPDLVLQPAVWVYWNYPSEHEDALRFGYDTMLIKFEDGRASYARIVSGAQVRALIAAVARGRAGERDQN